MISLHRVRSVVLILTAIVLGPQPASAMTVEMFDAMAAEDQHEYLTLLVRQARDVLKEDHKDLAAKLEELFQTRRGQRQSPGEAEFEKQLTMLRDYRSKGDVYGVRAKTIPGDVEGALIGSIQKNGILMTHTLFKALSQAWAAKPYWPKRPLRKAESERREDSRFQIPDSLFVSPAPQTPQLRTGRVWRHCATHRAAGRL